MQLFVRMICLMFIGCFYPRVAAFAPPQLQRNRITKTTPSSLEAIPLFPGAEDAIFNAQNIASSLANSVISPGTSTGAGGQLQSLLILYTAGLWTSFSPCSLGLLPITVSYITNAAQERQDKNTIFPTLAFAAGLAVVFTALGVSASALGGVFGGSAGGEGGETLGSLFIAAASSLVCVLMGLQLLELIQIPLPSLDFKFRAAFDSKGSSGGANGSLFDENGGLLLDTLQNKQEDEIITDEESGGNELAALLRVCLLGGTSALVASPCATPVLASLLAFLASSASEGDTWKGASWMLTYTLGYSTPLLVVGATGGQALVNLQKSVRGDNIGSILGQLVTPLSGGVLIAFGLNGFLVALLGDPSLAGLAPIIE
mmetsp:Transcript_25411/g.43098  ORF Transcript_25411/g.43098 Transcript_25411/m.43098 type:complete len:372 (-) Transcript_25411:71-1186(-)